MSAWSYVGHNNLFKRQSYVRVFVSFCSRVALKINYAALKQCKYHRITCALCAMHYSCAQSRWMELNAAHFGTEIAACHWIATDTPPYSTSPPTVEHNESPEHRTQRGKNLSTPQGNTLCAVRLHKRKPLSPVIASTRHNAVNYSSWFFWGTFRSLR